MLLGNESSPKNLTLNIKICILLSLRHPLFEMLLNAFQKFQRNCVLQIQTDKVLVEDTSFEKKQL